ncbi:zinc finger BED domain-containing protein RICESLEEPER 2-like [Asparagus officinalis]|uniref:zinc finger BED domain-containing protein RICESLEEPER 2-like n=1 Tax=Asparagus officinalis TaxID=4686 RepID=UPI00098E3207|nr:zinc finger BED domain-containing protein RICESLEEPER 2-like [Asparagus officinalis]
MWKLKVQKEDPLPPILQTKEYSQGLSNEDELQPPEYHPLLDHYIGKVEQRDIQLYKKTNKGGTMLGGKYLHMRYIAHIVNLIVSDGLKGLGDSIARVRSAVRYMRWNSTYLMLNIAQKYEKAFERYGEEDPFFRFELSNGNGAHGMPLEDDWVNVRSNVACDLQKWRLSDDASYARIANRMIDKYEKYWGSWEKTNMLIYIAALLDPRNKEDFVTFILELTYDEKESIDKLKFIKDAVFALFNDYKIKYGTEINARSVEAKSELEKFLSEDVEADQSNFDILAYWKVNSARFPILSRMVYDVLAIPISIVTSESTFSTGGRVLDPFRSSLTPRMVQSLVYTFDWLQNLLATPGSSKICFEEDLDALEKLDIDLGKLLIEPTIMNL